jgi:hypothetical protein
MGTFKKFVEINHTFYGSVTFPESLAVYEIILKNMVDPDKLQLSSMQTHAG